MPVLARCPLCKAVLPAGSADAPGEVRCPRCAEMVLPASRKLCVRCSRDVTREKRTKDATGEYYCADCWSTVTAESTGKGNFECAACGDVFAAHEVTQVGEKFLCRTCRMAKRRGVGTLDATAGAEADVPPDVETFSSYQARHRRQRNVRIALWCVAGALLLTAVVIALYARR